MEAIRVTNNCAGTGGASPSPWPLKPNLHHASCEFMMEGAVLEIYYNGVLMETAQGYQCHNHCTDSECPLHCQTNRNISTTSLTSAVLGDWRVTKAIRFAIVEGAVVAVSGVGPGKGGLR